MGESRDDARARVLAMVALVVAGEVIFSLPFHVPRYFRPSVLAAFDLSNAALGDIFAVYGVTAMLSYVPGGLLADRFSARSLMAISLAATAAGGLYMATMPGTAGMSVLYGYFGMTTILLFWAPMIRATRLWGGELAQGRAFGILDGGRGLVAAVFAGIAVWCFGRVVGSAVEEIAGSTRREGMRVVILFYSAVTLAASWLVLRCVPRGTLHERIRPLDLARLGEVVRMRVVWLQALVVVSAYCGFKGLDNYSLYAFEVLGHDETEAARLVAGAAYLRPLAAIGAGLIADRVGVAPLVTALFATLVAVYALLASPGLPALVGVSLALSFVAVFALRGVYFALLQETRIPYALTGAAVGVVSLVGFTPDVFFAAIGGRLLDASPGAAGHRHYFAFLAVLSVAGMVAARRLARVIARQHRCET